MNITFIRCSVDGCERNSNSYAKGSRGYCNAHYKKLRRCGDPRGVGTEKGEPLRWIEEHASYAGDGCLVWPFKRSGRRYGEVWVEGHVRRASRLICRLAHGPEPTPEHEAAHSCGNPPCCNPRHLRWATPSENMADKLIHDTHQRGSRNGSAKLSDDQARQILALRGSTTQVAIAAQFQISVSTVNRIHSAKAWVWLSERQMAEAA